MYEIKAQLYFSAAHHLLNYDGECENQHGHNWLVEAYVQGTELDKSNILIDYKILKKHLKEVLNLLDHKDINELEDYSFDLLQNLQELQKIVWMGCTKNTDQIFLNYFDVKRSINEISVIYGVTHQNVSKKLTRICKNALKKLRAHKGCACLNEEVDNKLSA